MVSRRVVLGASVATATAAVGAVGVAGYGLHRAMHLVGLDASPDHRAPASGWEVVTSSFDSAAMGRSVSWSMAVDPSGVRGAIVCLHGRNNDHRYAFDKVFLHDAVAEGGGGLAVVSIDGGRASYWHRRADGTDAMRLVVDELLPAVEARIGPVPVALMGWSMGGYGALLIAQRHPDRFVAAVATSPALWRSFDESADGAFDGPEDFAVHDVFAGVDAFGDLPVRIDCGTGDGFVDAARDLAAMLPTPNLGRFSSGYHDAAYNRSVAPDAIATINAAI